MKLEVFSKMPGTARVNSTHPAAQARGSNGACQGVGTDKADRGGNGYCGPRYPLAFAEDFDKGAVQKTWPTMVMPLQPTRRTWPVPTNSQSTRR